MIKSSTSFVPLGFLLAGGLALAFGQGHWPNGIALLAGIVLWIRFFRIANPVISIPLVTILNVLVWEWSYYGMVPLPTVARIGMFSGISFVFAILFFTDRWVNKRIKSLSSTLVLPCGWVLFDLVSARFSPGGTWASIAYTYAEFEIFSQVASLAGWTGITFVVVWMASTFNWIWDRWPDQLSEMRRGIVAIGVVLIAVLGFGIFRLSTAKDGHIVRVACIVAPDTFQEGFVDDVWAYTRGVKASEASASRAKARIDASLEEHFGLVQDALKQNPDIVLWPEANAIMTLKEEDARLDRARKLATEHSAMIGMGLIVFRPNTDLGTLNKFVLIDEAGNTIMDTLKATRVPGSLNAKGDGQLPIIESKLGRLSAAICFDMDFPHLIGGVGGANVDLFLAPSNDWLEVKEIHGQMARMRAIEQGFALVRPTKDGKTLMTDSTGRMYASMSADDDRTALLVSEMPVGNRLTLYSMIGDGFGFFCGLLFFSLILMAFLRRP